MVHGSAVDGGGSLAWRGRVPPWTSARLRAVFTVNRASWPALLFGVCSPVEAGMVWRGVGRGCSFLAQTLVTATRSSLLVLTFVDLDLELWRGRSYFEFVLVIP